MREKYQPINLVLSAIKARFGRSEAEKLHEMRDNRIYEMGIRNAIDDYGREIRGYEENLSDLKALLAFFTARGVEIIFFEMPIDAKLGYTPRPKSQHEILRTAFPSATFLAPPKHEDYETSDGVHLMFESARRFSEEFLRNAGESPKF